MKIMPSKIVQLIHIEGPFKNQIQEFDEPEISIGRHPSCHVHFPVDNTEISRRHAKILREGNQFKIIDLDSTNGTYLNGKRIKEAILQDGDVLIITRAKGGPKVSFLTKNLDVPLVTKPKQDKKQKAGTEDNKTDVDNKIQRVERVKIPLSIVFGPTIRSFNELPIIIGAGRDSDFVLDHPQIFERHAQIFFDNDQYWIKDLTGRQHILVNGKQIGSQMPLIENCTLSLSPRGPEFKFLGKGHMIEIEDHPLEEKEKNQQIQGFSNQDSSKVERSSLLKKFWKK